MSKTKEDRIRETIEWCHENNMSLLDYNGVYRGVFTFIHNSGNLSGYIGNATFERIAQTGGRGLLSFNKLLYSEKIRYIRESIEKAGASIVECEETPLSVDKPIKFIVKSGRFAGCEGEVSAHNLASGNFSIRFQSLSISSKKKYFDSVAKSRLYEIKDYPLKLSDRCILVSPKGNEWSVCWNSFDVNKSNCPLDSMNEKMSYGEKIISAILKKNNISYTPQKTIMHDDGRWQYMDFYIEHEQNRICIEYHGIQHYEEVAYFSNNTLNDIVVRDYRKKSYCKDNDIAYVEIPYTQNDISKIYNTISKIIPLHKKPNTKDVSEFCEKEYTDCDVINYFKNHTQVETAEKFSISTQTLYVVCKRAGFKKVSRYIKVIATNISTNEEIVFDSIKEATKYTGVDVKTVFKSKKPQRPRKEWVFKKL